MTQDNTTDLVIVGAGMVGLTLAALLAESGLSIRILESREVDAAQALTWEQSQRAQGYDPRVSALTIASQQVLTVAGVWPQIEQMRLMPYRAMDVWDGEGTGAIRFDCTELHEPCLGHIVENRVTQAALLQHITRLPHCQLSEAVALTELSEPDTEGLRTLTLSNGETLQSCCVVAADGALSNTRRLAGIGMWEWDYGHHAIVTTVTTELPNQATCWQRFTEDGPLAFLPLSDSHLSSIVWSTSPDHAKALMELDDDAFCLALERAFEGRLGRITHTDPRAVFPLRQRHAKQYVKAGFAAIGDAAHTIHPLAGQGVNLGLMDAAALAETILEGLKDGVDWHSEYHLRRFQRARQSENLQMAATMEGFKRLFNAEGPLPRLLRNTGMTLMNRCSPVKNHIVQQAMGLSGPLPRLARRPVKE
ncbi:UbiH/UbiF/VisC/COQ6 family ubiquinone biosynthesis hydroxylase [Amphritea sp. 2_MG-2023]|uniref:UbiH/UbiF/VisC/COQ6 family ubiquinone biosynthesis hydroxylase n=1 Tax=Amphritea TaxID=515417 RepID=UPI001C077249|nr:MULTISPECIES: UbiH/UbiF/VisC/COQ6 family ubiquinone biosynthesis hydroxylase [Amphritea]MBU2967157.1 UbiH/UbiF/VisC/COQ6 family ubiquinone biosynthesis hydroxylase [Amphritea atlantica]MDO6419290.1 UbiH/UbiF/VisC/COQ6 family ubiquinone biosynthesis hydroxylase [Amphritea sp. 2_MG-2023]